MVRNIKEREEAETSVKEELLLLLESYLPLELA
jgi:hypothetical protein